MKLLCLALLLLAGSVSAWNCTEAQDGRCLSTSTFCWKTKVYECANSDFHCKGQYGPCVQKKAYPKLPGTWTAYKCLNNLNFANGDRTMQCAAGTQCWPPLKAGWSPCISKVHDSECPEASGNGGCVNDKWYCENGEYYKCPTGLTCAGKATAPLGNRFVAPCAKKK